MNKRILTFLLTAAILLSLVVVVPMTASADTIVNVSSKAELEAIVTAVNGGTDSYAGKTVNLTSDIDLSGSNWTSIGNSSNPFRGSFNGNGHIISGMTRSGGAIGQNVGLFGVVSSPDGGSTTIQNFKLTGSIASSNGGENAGTVISAVKPSTTGTVTVNITGVWSAVNFDAASAKMTGVGGILGTISWVTGAQQTTINIDSCRYSGTLDSPSAGSNDYGGIMGYPKEACGPRTVNITNCIYDGVMYLRGSSPDDNGGIVGYFKGNGGTSAETHINIADCIVAGQFNMPNQSGQSVTGYVVSEASGSGSTGYSVNRVYYCNDADRSSGADMGGWYGYYKGGSGSIPGLISHSDVTAKTMTELKALSSGFSDNSKWYFGTSSELPVPAMIYDNIIAAAPPSIFDDLSEDEFTITTADELTEFASLVNSGTTFAGKTIKLGADVALNTTIGETSSKPFMGNFNGQGHTVTINQTIANPDGVGGLFSFVRTPASGSVTIQNLHITGTITLTNTASSKGYVGGLISTVDGNTSGSGGTLNISNVWNTVRINANTANTWYAVSGFVGFARHAAGLKPLSINFDSCLWDGILNFGPASEYCGGLVGYTGNQGNADRPLTINISNTVVAGKMMLNTSYSDDSGLITGYLKGNGTNNATSAVTVNMHDVVTIGKITSSVELTKWMGLFETSGTTAVDLANFYYISFDIPGKGAVNVDDNTSSPGTVTGTATVKTKSEMLNLTTSAFSNAAKWSKTTDYYPCPAGIVSTFGETPASLYEEPTEIYIGTDEQMAAFAAAVNGGTTYEGKTVYLTADVALNTTIGETSSKPFMGNFDGQGHTVTITQTLSDPDGVGGLFSFVRTPASGTVTIENVTIVGNITATNSTTGKGYFGALISCVDGNTSGNGGTINISNVRNSVYINLSNSNAWYAVSGFIGFTRHADGLKPLTINIDSCLWDGTINAGPALYYGGGFIGYTGNNKAGRTLTINLTNSVAVGKIMTNQNWTVSEGVLIGYAKGSNSDAATAKVTINISDVISYGAITNSKDYDEESNIAHIGEINGTTELNMTNVYYRAFYLRNLGYATILASGTANTTTNVAAMAGGQLGSLTSSDFTDSSKWTFKAASYPNYYIPCPTAFANPSAWMSSLTGTISMTVTAEHRDTADAYEGIRFIASYDVPAFCQNGGTASANFGIILISKYDYDNAANTETVEGLVAAGGLQISAVKYRDRGATYTVSAVLYNINESAQDDGIVAVAYVGSNLSEALTTSYLEVVAPAAEE